MASFQEVLNRLNRINNQSYLQKKVKEIVLSDDFLPDAKAGEFKQAENPDGTKIGTYRSASYENMKRAMNPTANGFVDLMLTGAFIESFFVKSKGSSKFTFDATDVKKSMLKEKYGEQIMGLNEKTFEEIQKNVYAQRLLAAIKKELKL